MIALGIYLIALSFSLTVLLLPLAIKLGHRWGVLDHPGPRKIHIDRISLTGGWAIFITISLILWGHFFAIMALQNNPAAEWLPDFIRAHVTQRPISFFNGAVIYAGALIIFLVGLVDDLRGMSVRNRLMFQLLVAAGLAAVGLRPNLGSLPAWLSLAIGVLWIVGITNAFNLLDGLDGLSVGVAMISSLCLLPFLGGAKHPIGTLIVVTLIGAQLGFLVYNFYPARVFLGSSGSLLIGYFMSVLTISVPGMLASSENFLLPFVAPVLLLIIPIYDTISVVIIRLIQKRPIAIGDQSHFHHRLRRIGFSHRQTVLLIWLLASCVSLSAVLLIRATVTQSLLILLQSLAIICIIIVAERVGVRVRTEFFEKLRPKATELIVPPTPPPLRTADREVTKA
jgi:UDP-GlcNAc:undecaprenyl-phosphate/decaprenyl-phosphate GlcNAc-1-phosphate transferase